MINLHCRSYKSVKHAVLKVWPKGIMFVKIKAETDRANQKVCQDHFLPSLVLCKVQFFCSVRGLCFLGVPALSFCPAKTHDFKY